MDYADLGEQLQVGQRKRSRRARARLIFDSVSRTAAVKNRAHAASNFVRRRCAGVRRGEPQGKAAQRLCRCYK
jgi:hypothetical protein